jgi:hypothetical protein
VASGKEKSSIQRGIDSGANAFQNAKQLEPKLPGALEKESVLFYIKGRGWRSEVAYL